MLDMIKLTNIKKVYGSSNNTNEVLHGISLTVKEGDYIAIMGTSGSGKSTLLNIIGCMDLATSGEYLFSDTVVSRLKGRKLDVFRKDNICFVFQQFALMNQYTVYENVELPLLYKNISSKKRRKIIVENLKKMKIDHLMNKKVTMISGGEQQRCAIARALASGNKLILADEPTGALDQKTSVDIMACFDNLHKEGRTIIMVTHDENVARHAERIVRIEDGALIDYISE